MNSNSHPSKLPFVTTALLHLKHGQSAIYFALLVLICTGCAGQGRGKFTKSAEKDAKNNFKGMKAVSAYDEARQHFLGGNLEIAYTSIEESINANPTVPDALLLRTQILIEMGKHEKVLEAAARGRKIAPNDARFPYYMGIYYERIGKSKLALPEYQSAAKLNPDSVQYKLAAAEMLIDLDSYDETEKFLKTSIDRHPNAPGLLQVYGHLLQLKGNYKQAIIRFREALAISPKELTIKEDIALLYFHQKKYSKALQFIEELMNEDAYNQRRDIRSMAVECYIWVDDPVKARVLLRDLIKSAKRPSYSMWQQMSDVATMLDDLPLLHKSAVKMISIKASAEAGHMALALYEDKSGNTNAALKILDDYVKQQISRTSEETKRKPSDLLLKYRKELQSGSPKAG